MKLRGNNKPSISPDKYTIGPNMVVNLAEPSKKMGPNDLQVRMNQTSYNKAGGKANFFPSTATATTNGSSGNGSSDPRRTTDATTHQPSISNQSNSNNQVDLNMQMRFNKNQIRLSNGGPNATNSVNKPSSNETTNGTPGICQTTKNAW